MSGEKNDSQHNQSLVYREQFTGPLPPPQVLQRYNEIIPGLADRIVKMAEDQATHRRDLESKVIQADIRNSSRGQYFGLVIGIGGLIAAVIISIFGQPWSGAIIGTLSIGSLIGNFVYTARQREKEREGRQDISPVDESDG